MAKKYCYLFSEGNANMRELLGGKGANLAAEKLSHVGITRREKITLLLCRWLYSVL